MRNVSTLTVKERRLARRTKAAAVYPAFHDALEAFLRKQGYGVRLETDDMIVSLIVHRKRPQEVRHATNS